MNRWLYIGVIALLCAVLGAGVLYMGHKRVQAAGYPGIVEYLKGVSEQQFHALNVEEPIIEIEADTDDLQFMRERREEALQDGIMTNDDNKYCDIQIKFGDSKLKAEMRLKGHMTDHLQAQHWSFRVKTKDEPFMGMSRFTLQHPGTRNYIYEWVFHQKARELGLVHLRYKFVRLIINGEDWGIYALEEHFGQELLAYNNRPSGAILRFEPGQYWEGRLIERERLAYSHEKMTFTSSYLDPYDEGTVKNDSTILQSYLKAQNLIEGFRRGELKTSEVFDVPLMAKYMALIDVVGGHHSLDWSDVKFYSNPKTGLIEPIAYESFSVRRIHHLAGAFRFSATPDISNFHNLLFSDIDFFKEYMLALKNLANIESWSTFIKDIKDGIDKQAAIIAKEFAFKPFNEKLYLENIRVINRILASETGVKFFLNKTYNDTLHLGVLNPSEFPMVVSGLSVNSKEIELSEPLVVAPKQRGKVVVAKEYVLSVKKVQDAKNISARFSIPGLEPIHREVLEYPYVAKTDSSLTP